MGHLISASQHFSFFLKLRVELNINGILSIPGTSRGWTARAVTLIHTITGNYAERLDNFTTPLGRIFTQERYAREIARRALTYLSRGWNVTLRGHSNGADLAIRAARYCPADSHITLHLIAGACDPSFTHNGLTTLMRESVVQRVIIHASSRDRALMLAMLSSPMLRLFRSNYGHMGLTGPRDVPSDLAHRVTTIQDDTKRHGDWVEADQLPQTLIDSYQT